MTKANETAVVKACLSLLKAKGCKAWRNNTGAMRQGGRYVKFGEPGSPDIFGILPGGKLICVECKFGKNDLSEKQSQWLEEARALGASVIVAYSSDNLNDYLEACGL